MKKLFTIILVLIGPSFFSIYGQNPTVADCDGAIPILNSIYDQPVYAYPGETDSMEINATFSCLHLGEQHGYWFEFMVLDSGMLSFNIEPYQMNEDYDWALFNLTGVSCADIRNIDSSEVRCNFSASPGITGVNGLSGAQNEPLLHVSSGEFYKLYLYNINYSTNGFMLNFGASSFTFDPILGIHKNELSDQIKIGPNPTQGPINITIDHSIIDDIRDIKIIDLLGKTLLQKSSGLSPFISFDLSNQPAGLYIVQISTHTEQHSFRLIVQ